MFCRALLISGLLSFARGFRRHGNLPISFARRLGCVPFRWNCPTMSPALPVFGSAVHAVALKPGCRTLHSPSLSTESPDFFYHHAHHSRASVWPDAEHRYRAYHPAIFQRSPAFAVNSSGVRAAGSRQFWAGERWVLDRPSTPASVLVPAQTIRATTRFSNTMDCIVGYCSPHAKHPGGDHTLGSKVALDRMSRCGLLN